MYLTNTDNSIIRNNFATNLGYGFVESSGSSGNTYIDNYFDVSNTGLDGLGAGTIIQRNQGYTTENSGNTTISSGNTYVDVTHGLSITPSINDINVAPMNNMSSATKFWVANVTSSTFRINVDQDPAGDANFTWQIGSY